MIKCSPRWQSRRTCTHLLLQELQNYNLLLINHQQENVGSQQKKILYIQGQRRSLSKMVAAAAAKSLQLCPTLRPHRQQPTRLPCPWDSPGKNTGVGCHFLLQCMKVKSESEVALSCLTLRDPMDCMQPTRLLHP